LVHEPEIARFESLDGLDIGQHLQQFRVIHGAPRR
jgi:hypothetical protein